eukprot:7348393-Prymnesium_polylepis.1
MQQAARRAAQRARVARTRHEARGPRGTAAPASGAASTGSSTLLIDTSSPFSAGRRLTDRELHQKPET